MIFDDEVDRALTDDGLLGSMLRAWRTDIDRRTDIDSEPLSMPGVTL